MPGDLFDEYGIEPEMATINPNIDLFEEYNVSPKKKGWAGVGQDISSSTGEFFGDLGKLLGDTEKQKSLAKSALHETIGANKQLLRAIAPKLFPSEHHENEGIKESILRHMKESGRAGQNVAYGLGKGARGIANIPANIADYLAEKEIIDPESLGKFPRIREPYEEMIAPEGQMSGDALLQALGEYTPAMLGGEVGLAGRGVPRAMANRAGAQGLHAIGQNEDPIKAALTMLTGEAAIRAPGAAGRAGTATANAMRPTNIFSNLAAKHSPNIPTEELTRALRATEGTQTPLGDVIKSPGLKKKFENTVAPMLGSGADEIFTNIANQINERGEQLVQRMSTNPAGSDPNFIAKNLLTEAKTSAQEIKNNLWNASSELAQSEGFNLELPSFNDFINENRRSIEGSPLIKHNPKVRQMFETMTRYRNNEERTPAREVLSPILDASGNPVVSESIPATVTYPSIREAKILASELGGEADKIFNNHAASSLDKNRAHLYSQMARRLRADVESQVNQKGSEGLQNEYQRANDFHREEFANFLDKDIFPLTRRNKSGQSIIRQIIKPGKLDQFEAIQKVNNLLPENQQELMGFSYLLEAFDKQGQINPNKMASLINALGPRQFQVLFNPETQQALHNYNDLIRMNKESIHRLYNPKTGARNQDLMKLIQTSLATIVGGGIGGIPGAVLGPASLSLAANLLTKAATSQGFREAVIGKKIRRRAETRRREQTTNRGNENE